MVQLPTQPIPAKKVNPQYLILFGKPKSGKTTLLTGLKNCLIIDLEITGTDYFDAMSVKASNLTELNAIAVAIKESDHKYDYIAIDTGTKLEEMVMPLAAELYKATPMGKNISDTKKFDVRTLPQGAGYYYLRKAFKIVISQFRRLTDHFILVCHVKDSFVEKEGKELSVLELDLTGKIKSLQSGDADAIGYIYRKDNTTMVNFRANQNVTCGARPVHLKEKEFVLAESDEDLNITFHWDKVYV